MPRSFHLSRSLRLLSNGFLSIWCLIALFPLLWVTLMSLKYPLDAFSANPLVVIFGPGTKSAGAYINFFDLFLILLWISVTFLGIKHWQVQKNLGPKNLLYFGISIGWLFAVLVFGELSASVQRLFGEDFFLTTPLVGMTTEHFQSVWIDWSCEYFSDGGDIGGLRFGSVRFKLGILDSHDCLGFQGSTTLCTGFRLPSMVHQFSRMAKTNFWGSRTNLIRPTLGDHCGTRINQSAFHDLDAPIILSEYPPRIG